MLPPMGPLMLGVGPEQKVATPVIDESPNALFADNLLSHVQATTHAMTTQRELDHTAIDLEASPTEFSPLMVDPDPISSASVLPRETYGLMPVAPLEHDRTELPLGLPPSGKQLPANDPLEPVVTTPQGKALTYESAEAPSTAGLATADQAVGPEELGLNLRSIDTVVTTDHSAEPSANRLRSRLDPQAPATPVDTQPILLPTDSLPSPVDLRSTGTAAPVEPGRSTPLAASEAELRAVASTGNALRGGAREVQVDSSSQPSSLRNLAAPNQTPLAASPAAPASGAGVEVTPLGSAKLSTGSPSPVATTLEVGQQQAQVLTSTGAAMVNQRATQVARNAASLAGAGRDASSVLRTDGLSVPAGNPLEQAVSSVNGLAASTQLRAALASMDPRQPADSANVGSGAVAVSPLEAEDAASPSVPSAAATVATKSTVSSGQLPSGLAPMMANARLDVSDAMNGQWVGRLSQMIAQQQLTGQSLRIALSPAELGSIELTFSGSTDNWAVSLNAQQGQTRELLESHLDRIRSMLQDLGIRDAQVAMADRWTGNEAGTPGQHSAQSQAETAAQQNAGWQHSTPVQPTAGERADSQSSLASDSNAASNGVDAYV